MSRRDEENRNPCCSFFAPIGISAAVGAIGSAVMGNGDPAFYAKVGALAGVGTGLVECCGDNANLLASLVVSAASWGGSAWLLAPDNNPDLVATAENFGAGFGVIVGGTCGLACVGLAVSCLLRSNKNGDENESLMEATRGKREAGVSSAVSIREASVQPNPTAKAAHADYVAIDVSGSRPS